MLRAFLQALAGLFAGTAVLCTATSALAGECDGFGAGNKLPALVNPRLAPRTTLLCNRAYASFNSGLAHEPLWSAERLAEEDLEGAERVGRVTRYFHVEPRVPEGDQATLSDYRGSGYDRGHLTPSGDAPDARAQEQTFSLANVVPQTPALNEGIWAGVEMAVRDLVRRDGVIYVVTGPAFHGQKQAIGSDNVLVPSSTWKAIYDPVEEKTGVYVCKNNDAPTCTTVSVATLIQEVGIDPFPGLSDTLKAQAPDLPQPEASPYAPRSRARRTGWEGAGRSGMLRDAERAGTTALHGLARTLEGGQ
ncbi:DNA/RNA non-specific endonuclease [Gluconacetobacter sp. 1b LMG 1731]|uniref:Endonuclease n=1 Tax=Gluconacetobacter dulcium TaxID=2729096 RepID=A0A7W4NSE5_9PROT|nr:DNA/RNA non-specific endonuclease [Gluconacetobacter dulcium]MBB2164534.1 DNA/RNA non-specific endonuclease [Gluconacetobacter dulcium]MBB2193699.1 DNA/RNA non-specific endonuclease [Gluconacetobacter dulcium]